MKFSPEEELKLKSLALTLKETFFLKFMDMVKDEVSDVRFTLAVKPEIEREVRLSVCKVIDDLIINPMNVLSEPQEPSKEEWV